MTDNLRDALVELAERGNPAGAATIVERALAEVDGRTVLRLRPATAGGDRDAQRRPNGRRVTVGRRLMGVAAAAAVIVVAVASGGLVYLRHRLDSIDRIDVRTALAAGGVDEAGQPMNILLVGTDSRAGLDPADGAAFGGPAQVPGARADVIVVVRVEPATKRVALMSVPRDLWVSAPGTDHHQRINSLLTGSAGRPASVVQLIQVVQQTLGIGIDHYMEIDFAGFRRVVSAVGGITIPFPAPARDSFSGLNVKAAGCVALDGDQALAYVRSRHYEYFENGRWHNDPGGDLGRIQRQQNFLVRLAVQAAKDVRDPLVLNRFVQAAIDNVTLDDTLSTSDLTRLASHLRNVDPATSPRYTLPVIAQTIDGADVLTLDTAAAAATVNQFLDRTVSEPAEPRNNSAGAPPSTNATPSGGC